MSSRNGTAAKLAIVVLTLVTTGCASFAFVNALDPAESLFYEASVAQCTDSKGWVIFDGVLTSLFGIAAIEAFSDPQGFEENYDFNATTAGVLYAGSAALGFASARSGNARVDACRTARVRAQIRENIAERAPAGHPRPARP